MIKNTVIIGLALVVYSTEVANDHSERVRETMLQESVNTLEDMHEWMVEDIKSGTISEETGVTYLANIEGTAKDLVIMTSNY
tara:strand:- start:272 stop:517 length:246 start_codon:yes stop_codon:yes gene_type:complete